MGKKLAVVAIGGNSLIPVGGKGDYNEQRTAILETCKHIADIIENGYQVVITHGNGPQVGFALLRSEKAASELPQVPLTAAVAATQGDIAYDIQQCLNNELSKRKLAQETVSIITQVVVEKDDPGFKNPTKFIGGFYEEKDLLDLKEKNPHWIMKADSNRGYRRVVPSPCPKKIVELKAIKALLDSGFNVIAVGGGGIAVVENKGILEGINAVIDKDLATALLAKDLKSELLIISTAVEQVTLNFGKDNEEKLSTVGVQELTKYLAQGHFPAGSMGPKISAALDFLKNGGKKVIITSPSLIFAALMLKAGTHIIND